MNKLVFVSIMIFVAALSRLIPHPGNFTPVMAIAIFAGASILSKRESLIIPLIAMLISDVIIGFHSLMLVVYGCMALFTFFGWNLQKNNTLPRTLGFGLFGAVFFFVVTNFAVWISSGMYTKDISGLIECYVLAIPFFHNTVLSTLIYGFILFGGTKLFEKYELVKVKA
ncbi:MAG: hypothetical protein IPL26_21805 [Leptospiraceae bacterium]|nr:hypothetical protein [Leptospiraceae bacterium]